VPSPPSLRRCARNESEHLSSEGCVVLRANGEKLRFRFTFRGA
jgi:hypothetical protein